MLLLLSADFLQNQLLKKNEDKITVALKSNKILFCTLVTVFSHYCPASQE